MFRAGEYSFPAGRTLIMGILNYTPDSFSDGGKYNTPENAADYAALMESQGADIIDIGCNSTRPGADILNSHDELLRLKEALPAVRKASSLPVSVDTFYYECASYALENGAVIINDVSGEFNEKISRLAKKYRAGYIVTHNPCGADGVAPYPDGVTAAVMAFFAESEEKAKKAGFPEEYLCLDPGFGFGKSVNDNYELLSDLGELRISGTALLAGVSRKRFIKKGTAEETDFATCAANASAILAGADIIRTHNITAACAVRDTAEKIKYAKTGVCFNG